MEGGGGFAGPMSLFTNANGRWDLKVMVTTSDDSDTTSASEIWVAITIDDGNSTTTTAASDTTSLSSLSITAATSTRYGPPMRVPNTLTISMGSVSGRYVGPGYLKRIVAVCFLSLFSGLI
jgi:hypothetical protein